MNEQGGDSCTEPGLPLEGVGVGTSRSEDRPHQICKEFLLQIRVVLPGEDNLVTGVGGRVRRGISVGNKTKQA